MELVPGFTMLLQGLAGTMTTPTFESFVTVLAKSGHIPRSCRTRARHSGINLIMNSYTHTLLRGQSAAIGMLPDISWPSQSVEQRAAGT